MCATATYVRGNLKQSSSIRLNTDTTLEEIEQQENDKYLEINEREGLQHDARKKTYEGRIAEQ